MSLPSKYNEMSNFYTLLNAFNNTHKAINIKTKGCKDKIIKHVKLLYKNYFDAYKKNYDNENVKDEEKGGREYKQFEIMDNKD